MRRVPDLSKLHGLLGKRPMRGLDQILSEVIAEMKARQEN